MDIKYYKKLRKKYAPKHTKLIFILESPPTSGKYFYDEHGAITEPLFKAMMKLLNISIKSKKDGLIKFMEKGYLLVDATYTAVNDLSAAKRDKIIKNDFDNLLLDLKQFNCQNVILVKKNICKLLAEKLVDSGFKVLNIKNNELIDVPFPAYGWQKKFQIIMHGLLNPKK